MPADRCWFCTEARHGDMSSAGGAVRCARCGEFTDPATGGPWTGSDTETAPKNRPASAEQIAAWEAPVSAGRVPNPDGPAQFDTGLHGQPRGVPSK